VAQVTDQSIKEVVCRLGRDSHDEGIIRIRQAGYKNLCFQDFAGFFVHIIHLMADLWNEFKNIIEEY
jgi:hypothetical protein